MNKYLIVGLGNPGKEYTHTRHNIGYDIVDELVRAHNGSEYEFEKLALVNRIKVKARPVTVIKPTTYMNLSGNAVRYYLQNEKVDRANLLVVVDDIALALGSIRIRPQGSDGGHNGLKDIQDKLQTAKYPRMRVGVGSDFPKGRQVDYVLGKWSDKEINELVKKTPNFVSAIDSFIFNGISDTMNCFNS